MSYRRFLGCSQSPAPSYKMHQFDGIRIFKSSFPAGSWETYRYPSPIRYSEAPTTHIQTAGRVVERSGAWPAHEAGWMSREDDFIIPAGTFTRYAETDAVRWCCLGRSDVDNVTYVRSVRIAHGAQIDMAEGESILPLTGSLQCGPINIPAETRARCSSGPKQLTANGEVLAFVW